MPIAVIVIEQTVELDHLLDDHYTATWLHENHFTHGTTGESGDGPVGAVEALLENIANREARQAHLNAIDNQDDD